MELVKLKARQPVTIVAAGDSITAGAQLWYRNRSGQPQKEPGTALEFRVYAVPQSVELGSQTGVTRESRPHQPPLLAQKAGTSTSDRSAHSSVCPRTHVSRSKYSPPATSGALYRPSKRRPQTLFSRAVPGYSGYSQPPPSSIGSCTTPRSSTSRVRVTD
jgi:hypothetical protein